ncbi:MAG: hypothetical protein LBH19_02205 [Dysgonamonadaceae bacterium]|jgi:hypothetical protein|nr:hypothetical protein [Dysgonamonadaceae bacterium]
MKIKFLISIIAVAFIAMSCNPIEDTSARDEFAKKGTPVSVEELNAALTVTQPISGANQYVVINNARPDIPGTWFVQTATGIVKRNTNRDTIIYTANTTDAPYEIYFRGLSQGETVISKTFEVTVTDLPVDVYETFLTGALTASDVTAKRTWKFLDKSGALYNGMYGNWKYFDPLTPGTNSWGTVSTSTVEEKTMTFEFGGHKLTTYFADGSVSQTGTWTTTHEKPEGVAGELISSAPVLGTSKSWNVWSGVSTPYWIIKLTADEMILCFPSTYNKGAAEDWDIDAMYFFFVPAE